MPSPRSSWPAARRAVLAAVASVLFTVTAGTTGSGAAVRQGGDVSWPQCTKAQGGYGLPMPPDSSQFVVIGLTKGLPFTVNPCLATQVAWASARRVPAQAYTIPAFPTRDQLAAYGSRGPWSATTRWGQLANAGYAEGSYALDRLKAAGFAARMVWIDVESRDRQPWPTGSRAAEALNRAVVVGLARRLDEAGHPYGYYSNTSGWQAITGTWWAPGVPTWVPVGHRTSADAVAACGRPSFSTGAPHLAQWTDGQRDDDVACPAYTFAPGRPWPASGAHDLDGDWTGDTLGRDRSTGDLLLLTGQSSPTSARRIGTAWQGMDTIAAAGDLTGDGVPDVVARAHDTGTLWLYPRSSAGGWLPRRQLGQGWTWADRLQAGTDLTGDQIPDLLSRDAATGALWLSPGTGHGTLAPRIQVGTAWQDFDVILTPGDVDGDGSSDVLARRGSDGTLWLYRGNGHGGWSGGQRIGSGWAQFDLVAAPGDLTGDGAVDVVARERTTGRVWIYPTDGTGRWRTRLDRGTTTWRALDLAT